VDGPESAHRNRRLGVVVSLLTYPHIAPALPIFAFAAMWMLATARFRRNYRNALLQSRAAADEREYRLSKS
jgi:hypothetical protein